MRRIVLLLGLAAAGCATPDETATPAADTATVDIAGDEQAIRAINERWVAAVSSGDTATIAGVYADDAHFMMPNAPNVQGRGGIVQAWSSMIAAPGFSLTFQPSQIEVSPGGRMAYDVGTYHFRMGEGGSAVADTGKYLVVWEKRGDQWQVVADMFNSDRPAS